jgi:hypothetical protein
MAKIKVEAKVSITKNFFQKIRKFSKSNFFLYSFDMVL